MQAYSELADRQPADGADGVVRAQPEDAPPAVVPGAAAAQPTSDSDSDEFAPAPAPTLAPALARASQRPMPRGRPETGPTVPGLDDLRLRDGVYK